MYKLELTAEDMETIQFVGHRYSWSQTLIDNCVEGTNNIPEHVAWEIAEECFNDTKGGHSFFPMLDHASELAGNLFDFLDGII